MSELKEIIYWLREGLNILRPHGGLFKQGEIGDKAFEEAIALIEKGRSSVTKEFIENMTTTINYQKIDSFITSQTRHDAIKATLIRGFKEAGVEVGD